MVSLVTMVAFALSPASAIGQTVPDLNGLWDGDRNSSDLVEYMKAAGSAVPFTAAAVERYKKVDFSKNPNGFCLPPGPSRAITGPSPFQIVQSANVIAFLFENHGIYRTIRGRGGMMMRRSGPGPNGTPNGPPNGPNAPNIRGRRPGE